MAEKRKAKFKSKATAEKAVEIIVHEHGEKRVVGAKLAQDMVKHKKASYANPKDKPAETGPKPGAPLGSSEA